MHDLRNTLYIPLGFIWRCFQVCALPSRRGGVEVSDGTSAGQVQPCSALVQPHLLLHWSGARGVSSPCVCVLQCYVTHCVCVCVLQCYVTHCVCVCVTVCVYRFPGVQKPLDQYGPKGSAANGPTASKDDDFDLFGSDDEEEVSSP